MDRAGILPGDLFDLDAALRRGHQCDPPAGAIDDRPQVVLLDDVYGGRDEDLPDGYALDVHAEDLGADRGGFRRRTGELHAAGLAAPADKHLCLDDNAAGPRVEERSGGRLDFSRRSGHLPRRHRQPLGQHERLRVGFLNLHARQLRFSVTVGLCAIRSIPGDTRRDPSRRTRDRLPVGRTTQSDGPYRCDRPAQTGRRDGCRTPRLAARMPPMAQTVTLIPGDGIGPELAEATRRVLDASGVKLDWEVREAGEAMLAKEGTPLPQSVLDSILRNKVAIKGPITTPVGVGFRSVNVALRQTLGLYANLRPVRSIPGLKTRYDDVDLVIVRENTEDLYAGIEHMVGPDAAESIKIITRAASERIARFAFEYAVANDRRKVTAVHKANIMKFSDGLFLESCRTIAAQYEGKIAFEDRIVDNMCMQLVQKPELYDVLVLPNLYGDIVSDLCAGLVGGLGVAPGANIGTEAAVFEAVHGSAPKYAGQNKANPTALMLSGVLLLRHIGQQAAAERVEAAIRAVIAEGRIVTYDLGGSAGTSEFADAIVARLES